MRRTLVLAVFLASNAIVASPSYSSTVPTVPQDKKDHEKILPEQRMFDFYRTKKKYLGLDHAKNVLEAGKWTRYYARKVGLEDQMETLLCLWHIESEFFDVPGIDGLSFGRAQTRYGYQKRLREWWKARGEILDPNDHAISTQMAFGVAEFWEKRNLATPRHDIFDTVRRYNGCGKAAINHAKKVFRARRIIYGLKEPAPKPAPCPGKKQPIQNKNQKASK